MCFVDSDDYWVENVLGGLMAQVERERLDVLRFDYQNVRIVNSEELIVNSKEEVVKYEVFEPNKRNHRLDNDYSESVTDGVTFLNTRMSTACYAVMFVIRRNLIIGDRRLEIGDCLFTEGIYFEDTDWTPRMLCKARRVASTNTVVYKYLVREGSITNAVNRSKKKKVLDDKIHLVSTMQQQAIDIQKLGKDSSWFNRMIAATMISIIGMLSTDFYEERDNYLSQLKSMKVYPIGDKSIKARLINLSPRITVELLHLKNGHKE